MQNAGRKSATFSTRTSSSTVWRARAVDALLTSAHDSASNGGAAFAIIGHRLRRPATNANLRNLKGSEKKMRYLHTMLRVRNLVCRLLLEKKNQELKEVRRVD